MDIDIDTAPNFRPERLFPTWARAAVLRDDRLTAHPCGVYPQRMARDPFTGLAAIPYDAAEDLGYLKVDFLHLNIYEHFKTREEIEGLLKIQPDWTLLALPSAQKKLFQLSKHGELLSDIRPRDLQTLADCMALIRPGKRALLGLYKRDRAICRRGLYAKGEDGYAFKLSHALAYALVVWLQLHLISQDRL